MEEAMTAYINTGVIDSGLTAIQAAAAKIYITYTQQPTTYTEASSTYACANSAPGAGSLMTGPAAGTSNGRKLTCTAISSGSVTATQTAGWYGITGASSLLYYANSLSATQALTSGNTFSLAAFDCNILGGG
jgi:hypothetical protein